MEDLVNKLAELQAERKVAEDVINNDPVIISCNETIAALESRIAEARKNLVFLRAGYDTRISEINATIKETETQIIDTWDGEKRTVRYDAGLLKIRTTTSLKIHDGQILLDNLIHHFPTYVIVEKYISGFNKTQVRKFIDLHPQSHSVVELIDKTTVKLEVE